MDRISLSTVSSMVILFASTNFYSLATATEVRYGHAGGCYRQGVKVCVEEPNDFCDEGTFRFAHVLRQDYDNPLFWCVFDIEHIEIGRCGDSNRCSNLASRCDDPSTFVALDQTCTITRDKANSRLTTYGKCNDRCSWSPDDCKDGETWTKDDLACSADKVEIGACAAGYNFCSVSSKACVQPSEPYINHSDLLDKLNVRCILSEIPNTAAPTGSPTATVSPTTTPMTFTKNKNTICHPDKTTSFEEINDDECESECKASTSCKAYQVGKKSCTFFSGTDIITKDDKFKEYKCYEKKKKKKKFKKKKGALCNPRGAIGFFKNRKDAKCKKKCIKLDKCNSFMTGPDSICFIFKKSGTPIKTTKNKSFKDFDCYTLD